ncbi:MAG: Cardiolipin synthase B [Chlamydiae bacterium]|nr:Cardiolipin synthase B [Chlamydiota bacterium]
MSVQSYDLQAPSQPIHRVSSSRANENPQGEWNGRAVTETKKLQQSDPLQSETVCFQKLQATSGKQSKSLKRSLSQVIDLSTSSTRTSKHSAKKQKKREMEVMFVHGKDDHIDTYANCIDDADSHIIIASWNLNFIDKTIFSSLMKAKRREVSISLVVKSVRRQETLDCFYGDEDSSSDYYFHLSETKSHAKFLFVDSKTLVLGSYNALGDSYDESLDASVMLKGTVEQLWPFYMSIYETYTSIGEDLGGIFDGIAMISKVRNPGPRSLLQRSFEDGGKIFLLRTIQEHEEFLRLATPYNGDVSIYSPFSTRDNTLKRLQALEKILPTSVKVSLKVLPEFANGLTRLLAKVPNLQNRVSVEISPSHQKVVVLGTETICIGSLNWLSAAQDSNAHYSNAELSIVLQGAKADKIIKKFYSAKNASTSVDKQ